MPGHLECCTKPILKKISEDFGDRVVVNIMDQYRPEYRAKEHEDIARPLSRQEYGAAQAYARKLHLSVLQQS